MFKNQRLSEMMRIIEECQHITVPELAKRLYISEATVRRDIAILEKNNLVFKSYGGISLISGSNRFSKLNLRAAEHEQEKKQIAKAASSLICAGDTLFLDGSSTALSLIPFLTQKNLTVITNSLHAADLLSGTDTRVYMTGGLLLESSRVFVGSVAERALRAFHADKLFFSAAGVSSDGDISDYSEMEVQLRQIMLERSEQQYFLCDSSKFGKHFLLHIANTLQITATLSDQNHPFTNGTSAVTRL